LNGGTLRQLAAGEDGGNGISARCMRQGAAHDTTMV
jgi:hypothetical protein